MTGGATAERLTRLRARLGEAGLPALLVTAPANRRYLSGFKGSSGFLLVTPDRQVLVTDFRYEEASAAEAPAFERLIYRKEQELKEALQRLVREAGVSRLGFEAAHLTVVRHRWFAETLPGVALAPSERVVEGLRLVKDAGEIARARRAMALAEEAFARLLPEVRPGRSERELALELEFTMRRLGADGPSFECIVASGPRSSLPHGAPTDRRLERGDLVLFDFGAVFEGYCSDTTRTVVLGPPDPRQEEVHGLVLAAHRAAAAAVRAGVTAGEVDRAARSVIEAAGYGERFGHGTGHGLGLEVHEEPRLGPEREETLAAGMLVTIEPGIYLPGWGGVRIEDTVLVTEDGCESLNTTPKDLLSL